MKISRHLFFFLYFIFASLFLVAQENEIKNVILMIPDGASSNLLSIARWYQQYMEPQKSGLAIDPYLCGMVSSHSSDAPIGDSAPTISCYVSGQPTQASFLSMYPLKSKQDLLFIDSARSYQPMLTILEAVKYLHGKSTGLVFTCEFPHATPAGCAAHWYDRHHYSTISKQMTYNNIDVVMGGGAKYLKKELKEYLYDKGYNIIGDLAALNENRSNKYWALFSQEDMPYELERNPEITPSLAEMTGHAIQALSKNEKGFFLMIEGSKIDWASHDKDAKAAVTDLLAFDRAVQVALDFAKNDGQTTVVILPDHCTGGISLGNHNSNKGYDKLSLDTLMKTFSGYDLSTYAMAALLKKRDTSELHSLFSKYYHIELSRREKESLFRSRDYLNIPLPASGGATPLSLQYTISKILNDRSFIGFTTHGHTGEDVFLAIYHPNNKITTGLHSNISVNQYLCNQLQIENSLSRLSDEIYAPHQEVFKDVKNIKITIDSVGKDQYFLKVKTRKEKLTIESYTNYYFHNDQKNELPSIVIYVDKNRTFYLPKSLRGHFE